VRVMLEFVLMGLARWLRIDWLFWDSDGSLTATVADEQRKRQHNQRWALGFLGEKRREREQRVSKREARASRFVKPIIEFGRLGSGRKP